MVNPYEIEFSVNALYNEVYTLKSCLKISNHILHLY